MKHLKNIVLAIINFEGRHTVSKLNTEQLDRTDVSNDIKFIRDTKWQVQDVLPVLHSALKANTGKTTIGVLAIDDTVIEKRTMTKKMEGLGFHYSHTKGRSTYGHCVVSAHYRVGDISIPYDFEFYQGEKVAKKTKTEFKTKLELAQDIIERFQPFKDEKIYVTMDSWYTSKEVVKKVLSNGYQCIGALKMNRVFRLSEFGEKHKLSKYVSNLRNSSFEKISLNGEAYLVRRKDVYLNGIGLVTVVITKRMKDRSVRCIFSTDMTLDTEAILNIYSARWDIEVGYLYLKDRLGLGHYQMRRLSAIKKYCTLVFVAFGLLEILKVTGGTKSIGQSRTIFKVMQKRSYVDHVIEIYRRGVSKRELYKILKLVA